MAGKHSARRGSTLPRDMAIAVLLILLIELAFNLSWLASVLSNEAGVAPNISLLRLALEIAIAFFALCVRPSSALRTQPLERPKISGIIIVLIWLGLSLWVCTAVCLSTNFVDHDIDDEIGTRTNTMQYQLMADSLLEGKTCIDIEPPSWLMELDNPYDYDERLAFAKRTGESALFDYAFYEGSYYMYFGVLPAALVFAPYKAITGCDLSTKAGTLLLSILAVIALWILVFAVTRRYTRKPSIADFLLYAIIGMIASGIVYLAFYPSFYHIAILSSFIFATAAISCWIGSIRKDGSVRKTLLALGSLCMGCTLLCRPTFFLGVLLAFPIFWKQLRESRLFFALNKQAIANTACILIPCVLIGCVAMWWNAIRFGSPFDFGSNYNLTGFDMTTHKTRISGYAYAFYLYLVGTPVLSASFPFIVRTPGDHGIIVEPFYEGLLFAMPAFIFLLLIFGRRTCAQLKNAGALGFVMVSIVLALAIMVVDSTVAVTQRYQSDFHWLFLIALNPVLGALQSNLAENGRNRALGVIRTLLIICVIVATIFAFQNLWSPERYLGYMNTNPELYQEVQHWFENP